MKQIGMFSPATCNTFPYRSEWPDGMFPLSRRVSELVRYRCPFDVVPLLCFSDILSGLQSFQRVNGYSRQMEYGIVYSCNILSLLNKWEHCDDLFVLKEMAWLWCLEHPPPTTSLNPFPHFETKAAARNCNMIDHLPSSWLMMSS